MNNAIGAGKFLRAFLGGMLVLSGHLWNAHAQPQPSAQIALTARSVDNEHPAIAATEDGSHLVVAWDGVVDGNRRILMRERVEGAWLDEIVVDNAPLAENSAPSIEIDPSGNIHIAWLGRIAGKLRVFYTFRSAGQWIHWGAINADEPIENSSDAVNLRIDQEGRPWIAWQTGNANQYFIRCARLDQSSGAIVIDELTPEARNYNLFPQIFFGPEPRVIWYTAVDADFSLTGRQYDPASGQWNAYVPRDLNGMPANRLPFLMDGLAGNLSGLWLDERDFTDRVFLGRQNAVTQGSGVIIDQQPSSINESVYGAVSGEEVLATWCSDNTSSGPQVYLAHGRAEPPFGEVLVSDGEKRIYGLPRLAPVAGGAAVTWQSARLNDDSGRIWFREVFF